MGEVCHAAGDLSGAEKALLEAVDVCRDAYGPEHSETASALDSLAMVYAEMKRWNESEKLFREELSILEKELGESHPELGSVLICLSEIERNHRPAGAGRDDPRRVLKIYEDTIGPGHPAFADAMSRLAENYMDRESRRRRRRFWSRQSLF